MRPLAIATAALSFASAALGAKDSVTKPLSSKNILPKAFTPAPVFQNINLVHTINLEKSYVKESINVAVENIGSAAESQYYIPFTTRQLETIGGLEVRDKKNPAAGKFKVELAETLADR